MGDAARGPAEKRKAKLRFFKHDLFRPAFARRSIERNDKPVPGLRAGGKPASTFRDHALEEQTMIVTVFRSRLKPGLREEYVALANRMKELAQTMPGYISHKDFYANDGERVAIVEFAHEEGQRAWQTNPEHRAAQKLAREKYYTEYHIQVCTLDRESKFKLPEQAAAQT
jgi:heme-degrading monooxygenase HmoA